VKESTRFFKQVAQWRTHISHLTRPSQLAILILPMLLLGLSFRTEAQTEIAKKPTKITQGAAEPTNEESSKKSNKKKGPKVTGYIQFHFNQPIDTNNNGAAPSRFRVQRARLTLEGKVNKRVSYEMDIDPQSPQISGIMRDAFVNIKLLPHHTLRLGQQKVKFGYINQRSSSALYVVNRPEMADALSRGINLRDIGVSMLGKMPLGGGLHFKYAISLVNGAGLNVQQDNNKAKNVSGRIGLFNKGDGTEWRFGVSGAGGDMFETSNNPLYDGGYFTDFKRVGTDFLIDRSRFALNGEFVIGKHEEKERDLKETVNGYYLTLVGKTSLSIGPLLSYDAFDSEDRLTAGGYYGKPSAPFRLLLNYEKRQSDDRLYLWMLTRF
jgi:hypothetical protein